MGVGGGMSMSVDVDVDVGVGRLCSQTRDKSGLRYLKNAEIKPWLLHQHRISMKMFIFTHRISTVRESWENVGSGFNSPCCDCLYRPYLVLSCLSFMFSQ